MSVADETVRKFQAQAKGGSLMQPIAKPSATENATAEFEQVSARSAAPDVAYFHKFYEVKSSREAAGLRPKSKRKKRGADDEDAAPLDGSDDDGSIADSEALSDEMGAYLTHFNQKHCKMARKWVHFTVRCMGFLSYPHACPEAMTFIHFAVKCVTMLMLW